LTVLPRRHGIVSLSMADPQQLALIRQGVKAWNGWRTENPKLRPDLRQARLIGADLRGANLRQADLHQADLRGAALRNANLVEATLRHANLRGADLLGANLRGTKLIGADLHRVSLYETVLVNTHLRDVKGLHTCCHGGPSILDHRTLAQSGPLPLAFLRGCGLPDPLIEYLPSLFKQTLALDSCFISYSTKDQDFAEKLYADLQDKGIRCWLAPHHGQGGKKLPEPMDVVMRRYDPLLLILSERSMKSEWIKTEITEAREQEMREQRRMLFPVRLVGWEAWRDWECFDFETGQDAAREVHEYDVPDFSQWQDDHSYRTGFKRLVRDLKAEKHRAFSAT
jgi:hypothetical protein